MNYGEDLAEIWEKLCYYLCGYMHLPIWAGGHAAMWYRFGMHVAVQHCIPQPQIPWNKDELCTPAILSQWVFSVFLTNFWAFIGPINQIKSFFPLLICWFRPHLEGLNIFSICSYFSSVYRTHWQNKSFFPHLMTSYLPYLEQWIIISIFHYFPGIYQTPCRIEHDTAGKGLWVFDN